MKPWVQFLTAKLSLSISLPLFLSLPFSLALYLPPFPSQAVSDVLLWKAFPLTLTSWPLKIHVLSIHISSATTVHVSGICLLAKGLNLSLCGGDPVSATPSRPSCPALFLPLWASARSLGQWRQAWDGLFSSEPGTSQMPAALPLHRANTSYTCNVTSLLTDWHQLPQCQEASLLHLRRSWVVLDAVTYILSIVP